jgi:RNA polymerase sigma factor (sigma-70 family)
MSSIGSVTHWIYQLKEGNEEVTQKLWERYFQQLVSLARQHLRGLPRPAADEEDVALSAFKSFCRDTRRGRFPQLTDRDDLWRLLVRITVQKSLDLIRREQARKRRAGRYAAGAVKEMDDIPGREPTPEFAAQLADELRFLLAQLPNSQLQMIAVRKMEGYTNREIATELGCVPRTVERRLAIIRKIWDPEAPE